MADCYKNGDLTTPKRSCAVRKLNGNAASVHPPFLLLPLRVRKMSACYTCDCCASTTPPYPHSKAHRRQISSTIFCGTDLNRGGVALKPDDFSHQLLVPHAHELVHCRSGHALGNNHCAHRQYSAGGGEVSANRVSVKKCMHLLGAHTQKPDTQRVLRDRKSSLRLLVGGPGVASWPWQQAAEIAVERPLCMQSGERR